MPSALYCGRCLSTFEGNEDACPNLSCGVHRPSEGWGTVLAAGDLLDRHYRIEKCLAVGGAGLTYLAYETKPDGQQTGPKLAIKVLYSARASGPYLRRLSTEAQILQELAHENIVELRGFVHRAGAEPYLVTRFEPGGSLALHVDRVGPLSGPVAAGILRQVLHGLQVAHRRGVIHRDLKPDNVLMGERGTVDEVPHVRIADFGIAKVPGGVGEKLTRAGAFVGTPEFAAPEQFDGKPPIPATDVFASGALLVFMLTGQPPFKLDQRGDIEGSHAQVLQQLPIRLGPLRNTRDNVRDALQRVLDGMMIVDAAQRWSIDRVLAALAPIADDLDTFTFEEPVTDKVSEPPPDPPPPPAPPPSAPPLTVAPVAVAAAVAAAVVGAADGEGEDWTLGFARPDERPQKHEEGPDPSEDTTHSGSNRPPADPGTVLFRAVGEPGPPPPPSSPGMDAPPPPPSVPPPAPPAPPAPAPAAGPPPPPPAAEGTPLPHPSALLRQPTPPPPPTRRGTPAPAPTRATPRSDLHAPPPFVTDARAKPQEGGGGGRATAGIAGCFGLSLVSMGAIVAGGLLLVAVIFVAVAGAAGWFRDHPSPTTGHPGAVGPGGGGVASGPPPRFLTAPALPRAAVDRLERVVADAVPDIADRCGRGPVSAEVLVDRSGWVVYAQAQTPRAKLDGRCVENELEKIRIRMPNPTEGRAHLELTLR